MSTTYGVQSSITIPSDGDTIDAADVNVPLAALWDQHDLIADVTALKAILVPTHGLMRYVRGLGSYVFVTSGTYSAVTAVTPYVLTATDGTAGRWVSSAWYLANQTVKRARQCNTDVFVGKADIAKSENLLAFDGSAYWYASADAFVMGHCLKFNLTPTTGSALARHVAWPLNSILIHGATLTGARLRLQPVTAHASLPAMLPALSIVRYDPSNQVVVGLRAAGMTDDPSANGADYSAAHWIEVTTDQNQTIDLANAKGYQYWAIACNEGHTNAVAELQFFGLVVDMTTAGVI